MKKLLIVWVIIAFTSGVVWAVDTGAKRAAPPRSPDMVRPPEIGTKTKAFPGNILENLQVTYPINPTDYTLENAKIRITVRFNTDVERNTVVAGSTVKLFFPKAQNAAGQIAWVNDREFVWDQSAQSVLDICSFSAPDCIFMLRLTDGIKSKEGLKLDGDKNHQPGGDFNKHFILGCCKYLRALEQAQ